MTLVLEGTPSSGGPRCLRSGRGPGVFLSALSAVSASLVVSVSPTTWPGTLVGVLSAGAASTSSTCSAASPFSAFCRFVTI